MEKRIEFLELMQKNRLLHPKTNKFKFQTKFYSKI
jgi:hypothetical protein